MFCVILMGQLVLIILFDSLLQINIALEQKLLVCVFLLIIILE